MFKFNSFFKKHTIEIVLGAILFILLIVAIMRMRKRRVEKMTNEQQDRKRRMDNVQKGWNSIRRGIRTMVA